MTVDPSIWEVAKGVLNYLLLPFAYYVLREIRLLAELHHKMDKRVVVIETTMGLARRAGDTHFNEG